MLSALLVRGTISTLVTVVCPVRWASALAQPA